MSDTPVTIPLDPPESMGDTAQQLGRADRPERAARARAEDHQHLVAEAMAYTQRTGMPVRIDFAGEDLLHVDCDGRTIRMLDNPATFQFQSEFFLSNRSSGVVLGVFDTFEAAAEAPLPLMRERVLRVTLDVIVRAAPELSDDSEDADGLWVQAELRDLEPEELADVFTVVDNGDAGTYGEHPMDDFLAGSGLFVRFGGVEVHDAQWVDGVHVD